MPASQTAASERRTDKMITHELPKLKTPLKTPPKQATNPLQFVKVGPCPLYRTAQEQLQKVEEVKKIKQEVREDPEDWQSNLDNWKSSRRKRQEHIIERVVESKKLELEEHDRQRRRSKTFSEMMEERGTRGRKMSVGLAVYLEEDSNDLSDLGIGTSSGKSSVSGDTHEDSHSVLSDRDSEIEKNHSDVDQMTIENGNGHQAKSTFDNGFHSRVNHGNRHNQEYDSATTATASSPEPEEYTYEGAIRGYVSRVAQNIPRRSLVSTDSKGVVEAAKDAKRDSSEEKVPVVKVDVVKRREIFEKAAQQASETKNHRSSNDNSASKSIKERLSSLERQRSESDNLERSNKNLNRLSGDMSSIRERLTNLERKTTEREMKNAKKTEELESVRPLRERLSNLEKYSSNEDQHRSHGAINAKERPRIAAKELTDKRTMAKRADLCCVDNEARIETSTPSERSSSPDSEYRAPRAAFHRSLDSLDADASSGPDTFERVQSLEELDYGRRRYPASSSSAELLNDTDREDSGIHTADVSCSVSQADEPIDEELIARSEITGSSGPSRLVGAPGFTSASGLGAPAAFTGSPAFSGSSGFSRGEEIIQEKAKETGTLQDDISITDTKPAVREEVNGPVLAATTEKETAETSHGELHTNKRCPDSPLEKTNTPRPQRPPLLPKPVNRRPIIYQSPRVPPRKSPPDSNKSDPTSPTSRSGPDFTPQSVRECSEIDTAPEIRSYQDVKTDAQSTIGEATERRDGEEIASREQVTREDAARVCEETELSEEVSSLENAYAADLSTSEDVSPSIPESPTLPEPDTSRATFPPRITTLDTSTNPPPHSESHQVPNSPRDGTNLVQDAAPSYEDAESHDSASSQDTLVLQTTAPRSASRIPMPLPRKSVTKAPSSLGGQQPSVKARGSQPRKSIDPNFGDEVEKSSESCEAPKSQIPVPSSSSITNAPQPMASAAHDKRHTVVEVCEKLTVPRGETIQAPLVTPFITIVRTGEADDSEVRIDEKNSTSLRKC